MPSSGYLVVERHPSDVNVAGELLFNPAYKGIYRMVPFSMELFEKGFDDPYLFRDSKGPNDLIIDLELAKQFRSDLSEVHPPATLEIIRADEVANDAGDPSLGPGQHLGYDVACGRPFWSPIADPPDDPAIRRFLQDRINSNGLFSVPKDAFEYLRLCRMTTFQDFESEIVYKVWAISSIE